MTRSAATPANAPRAGDLHHVALVPAAGVGARMAARTGGAPKQYLSLAGRPMIWHALHALYATPAIAHVFVVLSPTDEYWDDADFSLLAPRLTVLRCGGATRAQSVCNGLRRMLSPDAEEPVHGVDRQTRVLVHDAARPCLTVAMVERLIAQVGASEAGGLLAVPVADTLKRGAKVGAGETAAARVAGTVARDGLWRAQTPQMFPLGLLLDALEFAPNVTDESSAIEALGLSPRLVEADATNFKVTYPQDLALAEVLLSARMGARG